MQWINLGAVRPTTDWQLFNTPVIGTELFRVRNNWTIPPYYRMRAYLGQFFSTTDEVIAPRRIYPIKHPHPVIELSIPVELKSVGNITRYIGVQLAKPPRLGVFSYDWLIELDEYYD